MIAFLFIFPYSVDYGKNDVALPEKGKTLEIVFYNSQERAKSIKTILENHKNSADLFLFSEYPQSQFEPGFNEIEGLKRRSFPSNDWSRGISIFSNLPLHSVDYENRFMEGKLSWIRGSVTVRDQKIPFWVIHMPKPLSRGSFQTRNELFRSLKTILNYNDEVPYFVVGDFNTTPYSPYFQYITEETQWESASRGSPFYFTWPSGFPYFYLSIDHFFYRPPLKIVSYDVLKNAGSDHYPIRIRLRINNNNHG